MTEHEFDRRITAALRAASTTPRDQRARPDRPPGGRGKRRWPATSLLVGLAAASLVAVGAVGVWLVRRTPTRHRLPPAAATGGQWSA